MKRRLLSMLAVVALGASVFIGAAPAVADEPPGAAYVALGDSEAAGTGNLPYVDSECLRSKKAYPMLLASWYGGVDSQACSGATTTDVLLEQIPAADLGVQTELVTITVGVNNADWQHVLEICFSQGDVACQAAVAAAAAALATLPADIAAVVLAVRLEAPFAQIVVTGYPLLFGAVTDTCSVGAFQGTPVKVTAAQAQLINIAIDGFLQQPGINDLIEAGVGGYVAQTGDPWVRYVPVVPGFAGHGLCDTGDRWISGLVSGAPVFDRGFHANAAGQRAFADIIAGAITP